MNVNSQNGLSKRESVSVLAKDGCRTDRFTKAAVFACPQIFKRGCKSLTLTRFRLKMSCLVFSITLAASPLVALGDHTYGGDTYFNESDFVNRVVRTMVPHWYVKNKMKSRSIRSFCYFDPKVENSIGCSWRFGGNASQNNNNSKNSAKKRCKQRGGSKCVQFWANGKLKYKKTPEADAKQFIAIFKNIGLQDYETGPLIEGKIASERSREGYQSHIEWFEKQRDSAAANPHQVVCGTGVYWTAFNMRGARSTLEHVRNMCVLSCQAFQDFFDRDEGCFIYSEDGIFVSSEAERILTN